MRSYRRLLSCAPLLATMACAAHGSPEAAPGQESAGAVHASSCPAGNSVREPIYIIDGVVTCSAHALERLNAEDILSVEVIKAIYDGSPHDTRAPRSVVIIKTRASASHPR